MDIVQEFIKEVRKFGQRKASVLSGVPWRTIQGWCKEGRMPTLANAQRVANAMGLEFLLFEKE